MCVASATREREGKGQKKQRDHTLEVGGLQKPTSASRVFWVTGTLAFYGWTPLLLAYLRPEAGHPCPPRERKGVTRKEERRGGRLLFSSPNL